MKIKIQKQVIESILINLQPFLEKKDASQITSHILFKIENNECISKATDTEIGLKIITNNIDIITDGSFTAHGKKLLDIIRTLKDSEITLELVDNILVIKQNSSKFKLPTFKFDSYPSFPTIEDKSMITLNSLELIQNLKKISPAIDNNNPKYELNGALINIKNNGTDLVSTDTKRLAIASIDGQNGKELSIIIPKKAIMEIQKLFLDDIEIFYDEINLIIKNKNYYFYTKLINGKYPDYQRIIPSTTKFKLNLPKDKMIEAIKIATVHSADIKMIITPESIILKSINSDEAKDEFEINTGLSETFEISFNYKYILDFISQINNQQFTLEFNESTLPFVVKDHNFITIIMPITI